MVYHDYIHEFIQSYITSAHSNGVKKTKAAHGRCGQLSGLEIDRFSWPSLIGQPRRHDGIVCLDAYINKNMYINMYIYNIQHVFSVYAHEIPYIY